MQSSKPDTESQNSKPVNDLGIIVVIPCFNETQLIRSLQSLANCHPPKNKVEVIVIINNSNKTPIDIQKQNLQTFYIAQKWAMEQDLQWIQFLIRHHAQLPSKHAGVGLARKIGMDEAVQRFKSIGNPKGIISCFDADSQCDRNYFEALEAHFLQNPKTQACSIHFEHPIEGNEFSGEVYQAIVQYELHLRYYIEAQKWAGFPLAFQTIGSSMAVRADAYQKQGGMNRRKAGEDFYFLHKFTPLGYFSELNTTKVIPSPRISDRVPFGTGKAIADILQQSDSSPIYQTYHPQSFVDLKTFFLLLADYYQSDLESIPELIKTLPEPIFHFLLQINFEEKLKEIRGNTRNFESFKIRFFNWFNAFMVMKFVHFARDHHYPNIAVEVAAKKLLTKLEPPIEAKDATHLLLVYRKMSLANGQLSTGSHNRKEAH
ncbi:MAG: glycosyltransferase family 2 protein [Chitinophagales bacterium]